MGSPVSVALFHWAHENLGSQAEAKSVWRLSTAGRLYLRTLLVAELLSTVPEEALTVL